MSEATPSLVEVQLARAEFDLDVRIEWNSRALVLFGSSGSGKTSLLRAILGLEKSARCRVQLAGKWLEDADRRLRISPHERRLGWVPQSPTLFPDRNVEQNIRFGIGSANETVMQQAVEVLELSALTTRSVRDLSGGEQQRVALARALATQPRALLLDEPLASLDLELRAKILPYLIRVREEFDLPFVYITHDPDEAMLLGEELAVLDGGRLVALGEPRQILWSRAVLPLSMRLGVENVLEVEGVSDDGSSARMRGGTRIETPWPVARSESLSLGLRAEDVLLGLDRPGRLSARNIWPGRVVRLQESGDHVLVTVELLDEEASREKHASQADSVVAKLTGNAVRDLELRIDQDVFAIVKSQALRRLH